MDSQQRSQFVQGALILAVAGLVSKILSAAYRIPLQNLTGDIGFYVYQQVYPFLGMIIILSLYGFPSAIAKITGELQQQGKRISVRSTYGPLFLILLFLVSIFSLLLWFNAHKVASLMGDKQLTTAYKWVAVAFLMIPFTSTLRGILQSYHKMNAIAFSQIGEQVIRVAIIMFAAILIANDRLNVYQMGVFGVLASISGSVIAICILAFSLAKFPFSRFNGNSIPWRYYIKTLFLFGVVASLNHMVLLIIQFADVFTLVPNLMESGLSQIEAMEAKGIFDRGQPLIQLGTVLGSSFALALVPTVARVNLKSALPSIHSSLKISFFIGLGAVIGLVLIFEETNVLLYQSTKGTSSLQVLSLSIFLSSLSITNIAILQSLGHFRRTALFIIGAFFVKWLGNIVLVPELGMMGGALSTVFSLLFLWVISLIALKLHIEGMRLIKLIRFRPLIISVVSMVAFLISVKMVFPYELLQTRLQLLFYVGIIVSIGGIVYILLLIRFHAFSKSEIQTFPFASLLLRIYKGRD